MGLATTTRLLVLHARAGSSSVTDTLLSEPIYCPAWPISPVRGRKIIKRQFDFCGYKVEMAGSLNWHVPDVGIDWHREFFSYKWLQDVAAINSEKIASSFAREFINGFTMVSKADNLHPCAWEAEVTGERLTHWLYYRHFVLKGGSRTFFARYQRSLVKHIRVLYEQASHAPETLGPNALKGLVVAASIFPTLDFILHEALIWLHHLMERDVHTDGGHVSHSPNHHLSFLRTLIEIREVLESRQIAFDPLNDTIQRMGRFLQVLCHGDGRLALFCDNLMEDSLIIARAVELSHAPQLEETTYAADSGYLHCRAADVRLIMRMSPLRARNAPLGIGSLEYSDGTERFIVNCGSYAGGSKTWRNAMHQPSAYSGLVIHAEGDIPAAYQPTQLLEEKVTRHHALLRYAVTDILSHERQMDVYKDGQLIRGKDVIDIAEGIYLSQPPIVSARFHLHPDIRVQQQKEGGLLLKSVSGKEWLFTCSLPKLMMIEESVYLGYYGKPQKTLQIVVPIPVNDSNNGLRWELKKLQ